MSGVVGGEEFYSGVGVEWEGGYGGGECYCYYGCWNWIELNVFVYV